VDSSGTQTVRFAHISDIHVTAPSTWQMRDWFSKRLSSWINLHFLGRGYHFRCTEQVLAALRVELRQRRSDHILFSGDATAMGFPEEVARAAALLEIDHPDMPPGLAVPGNHDYCTHSSMRAGHFEKHFAPWLEGERIGDAVYPFARRVGPVWVVAVNSATANLLPFDASGRVGTDQLRRLEELLARLEGGPRVLVTHYPVRVASGKPERRSHALRDLDNLLDVARRGGIGLWLHGHRHDYYYHPPSADVPFPVICTGSTTQHGLWSYSEYTLTAHRLQAKQRVFDVDRGCFVDGTRYELEVTPHDRGTTSELAGPGGGRIGNPSYTGPGQ
jgi:3',5'-cyclic AMP phosphodiesterase CpdA